MTYERHGRALSKHEWRWMGNPFYCLIRFKLARDGWLDGDEISHEYY